MRLEASGRRVALMSRPTDGDMHWCRTVLAPRLPSETTSMTVNVSGRQCWGRAAERWTLRGGPHWSRP